MPEEPVAGAEASEEALRGVGALAGVARWALLAAALLHVAVCAGVVALRIRYPFELEWMEGGVLDHVARVASGRALYARPSLEFVSFIYTPLYAYAGAGLSRLVGGGFYPLRLLSALSAAGCLVVICGLVRRETRSWYAGLVGAGLFAATFRLNGFWFDVARGDVLFLLFLLCGLYVLRFGRSWWSGAAAGVLVWLSFLTKQTALLVLAPLVLYGVVSGWRRGVGFAVAAGGLIAGSVAALDALHDGWFSSYIFKLPAGHEMARGQFVGFWKDDLAGPLGLACVVSALAVASALSRPRARACWFYVLAGGGMVGAAWASRVHAGGYANVLLPAHAMVAILFGVGVQRARELVWRGGAGERAKLGLFVYGVCVAQLALLAYDPRKQLPTREDRAAGQAVVERLAEVDGEVFAQCQGYLAVLAGKRSCAHAMAVEDVLRSGTAPWDALREEIARAIREKRFAAIVAEREVWTFAREVEANYVRGEPLFEDGGVFLPVTGHPLRPEFIWLPKKP